MEFPEYNWATISETICPKILIFGKKASWTLFFQNILTNPIISEISFLWHHHFSTLLVKTTFTWVLKWLIWIPFVVVMQKL